MRTAIVLGLLVACHREYGEYCREDSDCVDTMECWHGPTRTFCAPMCDVTTECPQGFACPPLPREAGARGACLLTCDTSADCISDWVCEPDRFVEPICVWPAAGP